MQHFADYYTTVSPLYLQLILCLTHVCFTFVSVALELYLYPVAAKVAESQNQHGQISIFSVIHVNNYKGNNIKA